LEAIVELSVGGGINLNFANLSGPDGMNDGIGTFQSFASVSSSGSVSTKVTLTSCSGIV
jgi:hypothetical protein